jgi:peptide/nickel transport system permease protein
MLTYAFKRILIMAPVLLVISFLVFVLVELPPGNYCSNHYSVDEPKPPTCQEAGK